MAEPPEASSSLLEGPVAGSKDNSEHDTSAGGSKIPESMPAISATGGSPAVPATCDTASHVSGPPAKAVSTRPTATLLRRGTTRKQTGEPPVTPSHPATPSRDVTPPVVPPSEPTSSPAFGYDAGLPTSPAAGPSVPEMDVDPVEQDSGSTFVGHSVLGDETDADSGAQDSRVGRHKRKGHNAGEGPAAKKSRTVSTAAAKTESQKQPRKTPSYQSRRHAAVQN